MRGYRKFAPATYTPPISGYPSSFVSTFSKNLNHLSCGLLKLRSRHDRHLLETALTLGIRALDTSYNYLGFSSHKKLALAANLLPEFTLSTKVGFFPGSGTAEHSLDPVRLRDAVRQSVDDLGNQPAVVFLHNPERTLAALPADRAKQTFASACTVLDEAVRAGLCRSWGLAIWNPQPLVDVARGLGPSAHWPAVLMVRSGLLVGQHQLDSSIKLIEHYGGSDLARISRPM